MLTTLLVLVPFLTLSAVAEASPVPSQERTELLALWLVGPPIGPPRPAQPFATFHGMPVLQRHLLTPAQRQSLQRLFAEHRVPSSAHQEGGAHACSGASFVLVRTHEHSPRELAFDLDCPDLRNVTPASQPATLAGIEVTLTPTGLNELRAFVCGLFPVQPWQCSH